MAESEKPAKRPRTAISVSAKKSICQFKVKNPTATQDTILRMAKDQLKLTIGRSTVSDILRESPKWLSEEDASSTKKRKPHHDEMEKALLMWFSNVRARQIAVSDDMLRLKARAFGSALNIEGFSYSNGWLYGFKQRHGISLHAIHGEAASVSNEIVQDGRRRIQNLLQLSQYDLCNVYNMDETGLFFRLQPDKTLSTAPVRGTKKSKERISVALCANADGSDKLKPLVIGKAARPRCFPKAFNVQSVVHYYHNKKAWMTSVIFTDWLKKVNKTMAARKKNIILFIDNAPSHVYDIELSHVKIEAFPPNTTSHLQPMDAGIIRNFKLHYKKQMLQEYVSQIDRDGKYQPLDLKQAIYLTKDSWEAVKPETIANCFRHTGILPMGTVPDPAVQEETLDDLEQLIQRVSPSDPLSAERYLSLCTDAESSCVEELTDKEILDFVCDNDELSDDSDEEEEETGGPLPYSLREAETVCDRLLATLEQCESFSETHYYAVRDIQRKLGHVRSKNSVQTQITDYFQH